MSIDSLKISTSETKEVFMKKIILIFAFSMGLSLSYGQEYKVVCKKLSGCPVINGTCPTCEIVQNGQIKKSREQVHREIDEWGKRMQEEMKYDYSSLKNDNPPRRATGWEWDGPTWKGLRVLY